MRTKTFGLSWLDSTAAVCDCGFVSGVEVAPAVDAGSFLVVVTTFFGAGFGVTAGTMVGVEVAAPKTSGVLVAASGSDAAVGVDVVAFDATFVEVAAEVLATIFEPLGLENEESKESHVLFCAAGMA